MLASFHAARLRLARPIAPPSQRLIVFGALVQADDAGPWLLRLLFRMTRCCCLLISSSWYYPADLSPQWSSLMGDIVRRARRETFLRASHADSQAIASFCTDRGV